MKIKLYMSPLGLLYLLYPDKTVEYYSEYRNKWIKSSVAFWFVKNNRLLIYVGCL